MRSNVYLSLVAASLALVACCKRPSGIQSQQGTLALDDGTKVITGGADDFGSVCPGESVAKTLTLANISAVDVTVTALTVAGEGFAAPALPQVPFTVSAGGGTPLPIVFTPAAQGPASGTLTVESDGENPSIATSLVGTGQGGAAQPTYEATCGYLLQGKPTTRGYPCNLLLWEGVLVGSHGDDTLTLSDTGCPKLTITSAVLEAPDGGPGPFSLPGLALPATVSPGSPLALTIRYTPTEANSLDTATLTLATNDPTDSLPPGGPAGVFVYNLTGAGIGSSVQLDPSAHDFGAVPQGTTASESFTVTNTGSLPVTLAAPTMANGAGSPFVAVGWDAGTTLAPVTADAGTSLTCEVRFTSPGMGRFEDELVVAYSSKEGTGQATATLVGNSSGQLCVSPEPFRLGPVSYCGVAEGTLVLGNCGNADLKVQGVSFADGGDPRGTFSVAPLALPATVAPDAGLTLQIRYADDGLFKDPAAVLLIQSDDPGAPDGGTKVTLHAQASPVPPPVDIPTVAPGATVGVGVETAFILTPGTDAPLYAYAWTVVATNPVGLSSTLTSDGGMAWLTPGHVGTYYVCVGETETALPDGGANCGFDAGPGSHCDPFVVQ